LKKKKLNKMKKIFLLSITLLMANFLLAQELEFEITVNTPKLQTADPKVFENLKEAIQEFLNSRKWTEDVYEPEERIKCKLQITIEEELSATRFRANIAIQSRRPIFKSGEETPMLNHVDKDFIFDYEAFQPIVFSKNLFQDNLSSVLGFYAYIVLGMDYDSFSPLGGEKYYQVAQDILTNIPQNAASQYPGWRQLDGNRNRYWIVESLLNPRVRDYRQAMYEYHRLSLDNMSEDSNQARAVMASAIGKINDVSRNYPNAMILQMFSNSKRSEVIEIFKKGTKSEKDSSYKTMIRIDPANASEYAKIGR